MSGQEDRPDTAWLRSIATDLRRDGQTHAASEVDCAAEWIDGTTYVWVLEQDSGEPRSTLEFVSAHATHEGAQSAVGADLEWDLDADGCWIADGPSDGWWCVSRAAVQP